MVTGATRRKATWGDDDARQARFRCLVERVQACRACPRMEGRTRVLGPVNGPLTVEVLIVAEAPGRLGADRSGIPFSGDQSGRYFERLLAGAGLDRNSVFITNAVLCNPRDERGRNAPPTAGELHNCSAHLEATIEIVQPRYVVALGQVALNALRGVAAHDIVLARDVGCAVRWSGWWLIPLYHPSPRAQLHRPLQRQLEDWQQLGKLVGDRRMQPDVNQS